jgi:hypothetical protein
MEDPQEPRIEAFANDKRDLFSDFGKGQAELQTRLQEPVVPRLPPRFSGRAVSLEKI